MDLLTVVPQLPEIRDDATIERRIELILDLTRRLELLDGLLRTARAKRSARDSQFRLTELDCVEIAVTGA